MKENEITKLALKDLDREGKIYWVAVKRKGFAQQDIFGIFDIIYLQNANKTIPATGTVTGFIQVTTKHHISDRRKKIKNYFQEKGITVPARCFVWAYDSKAARFIKELIL